MLRRMNNKDCHYKERALKAHGNGHGAGAQEQLNVLAS
jgi:hypothetical protein